MWFYSNTPSSSKTRILLLKHHNVFQQQITSVINWNTSLACSRNFFSGQGGPHGCLLPVNFLKILRMNSGSSEGHITVGGERCPECLVFLLLLFRMPPARAVTWGFIYGGVALTALWSRLCWDSLSHCKYSCVEFFRKQKCNILMLKMTKHSTRELRTRLKI